MCHFEKPVLQITEEKVLYLLGIPERYPSYNLGRILFSVQQMYNIITKRWFHWLKAMHYTPLSNTFDLPLSDKTTTTITNKHSRQEEDFR